jgi:hypothetical protein
MTAPLAGREPVGGIKPLGMKIRKEGSAKWQSDYSTIASKMSDAAFRTASRDWVSWALSPR